MSDMSRRTFLWLTGGSTLALATGPERKLVNRLIPQVIPPEQIKPGEWAFFATTCRECPAGCGMHLWHRDGRVTKAEGNPEHPVNRGGLCPRGQSALQGLYDPDRVRTVLVRQGDRHKQASWDQALNAIAGRMAAGARVALLSGLQTGALAEVLSRFAASFGGNRLVFFEPFHYEPLKAAHGALFGLPAVPAYRLEQCEIVLSFAADFLETWVSPVSYARQFANLHDPDERGGAVGRLVYVGPRLSLTAANADQWVQVPPGYERAVAAALVRIVIEQGLGRNDISAFGPMAERVLVQSGTIPGVDRETLLRLARQFTSARASVALAGPVGARSGAAGETAALAALLNYAAGRIGDTVEFSRPHAVGGAATEAQLQRFCASLGPDDLLLVHEANPVFARPEYAALLARAGMVVYLGTLLDETALAAQWVLPMDSPLESWGDYQPEAGVYGIMQPTMGRLHETRLAGDVLLELARRTGKPLRRAGRTPYDFPAWLRLRWEELRLKEAASTPAELFWQQVLSRGFLEGKRRGTRVTLKGTASKLFAPPPVPVSSPLRDAATAELWLWGSILQYDGRLANRGWLQEAPDPLSFMVWGNWIDLHPRQAAALELASGDRAELSTPSGSVQATVRVTEEIAAGAVALAFGQGHRALGRNARGIGANAYLLQGGAGSAVFGTCRVRKVEGNREPEAIRTTLTAEQHHREILQWVKLSELRSMPPGYGDRLVLPLPEGYRPDRDLYPRRAYLAHRWAMVADLNRCIGCGACAVACYAENNIPVVGKAKVGHGREMAWLRVLPVRKPGSGLRYSWLPLLCQHCDAAPCEPVCPVFAAMHNEEGLNAQIYNRCIGTRYCSNNCPYKVRRFNWLDSDWPEPLDLQLNPEVTVRCRGVMEKCTFCVQRIRQAQYRATLEKRKIADGEIQPACAQSCPTGVYSFGDLMDPESRVSQLTRNHPRRYHVLEELNTKPAVTYLRRVDLDA